MLVGVGERLWGTTARFRSGVPKQFAQFVGVVFSGLGALFLLLDKGKCVQRLLFLFLLLLLFVVF